MAPVPAQGEIYWLDAGVPRGSEPGYRRPVVVIQNDGLNGSGLRTAVIVWLTSNRSTAAFPWNTVLRTGEGGLPRDSVALGHQVETVDVDFLDDYVGHLPDHLTRAIIAGVTRVIAPPMRRR
jgi:mRNA interferase MazF